MQTWLKWTIGGCLVAAAIQLIQPENSNGPVIPDQTIHARLLMDPKIEATFVRSCNDCHSNKTVWPRYSRIAPISWLVAADVRRGRNSLNFSEWASYSAEEQRKQLADICEEVTDAEMPGKLYMFMHPSARLTDADVKLICSWSKAVDIAKRPNATANYEDMKIGAPIY